jgi:flagellar biosynthetic protein FliR
MPDSLTLRPATLYAFLLVLARVSGALAFVPFPGFTASAGPARTVFALALTLALYPVWPAVPQTAITPAALAGWALAESVVGVAIGVCVAIVLEAFLLAGQVLGLQAGYAYAQTVDPNSQADSGILLVFAQLMAGLFFFSLGMDRELLRLFAQSLAKVPPGAYGLNLHAADTAIRLASLIFSVGVRLALPVVALLVMVDVALALLGRLNSQLQLLSLAFPMKMLIALAVLGWIAALFPRILRELGGAAFAASRRMLGI